MAGRRHHCNRCLAEVLPIFNLLERGTSREKSTDKELAPARIRGYHGTGGATGIPFAVDVPLVSQVGSFFLKDEPFPTRGAGSTSEPALG